MTAYLANSAAWLAALALSLNAGFAQEGSDDPAFAQFRASEWITRNDAGPIRWTTRVSTPKLDRYQRLRANVEIQIDGDELVKRRGRGELLMLVQLTNGQKRIYRTHKPLDLTDVSDSAGKLNFIYTQEAYLLPGDYQVALGVVDTATGERGAVQRSLHVNALKSDPLPELWRQLPPVEWITDPPDDLLLPSVNGRLNIPVESGRPIRFEVLANVTPALVEEELTGGPPSTLNLREVIPVFRILAEMNVRNGSLSVSLADVSRQQVVFRQTGEQDLSTADVEEALKAADPQKIDARSLAKRAKNAKFFLNEVSRRMEGTGEAVPVTVVLSAPMAFASAEDRRAPDTGGRKDGKLYYLRFHPERPARPVRFPPLGEEPRIGRHGTPPLHERPAYLEIPDELGSMLKPLHPRTFDIYSPDDFRKALKTILDEVKQL
jgi:hypothetical protein